MADLSSILSCPICLGVSLEKRMVGKVTLDYCGRCGGIWFDAGEVEVVKQQKKKSFWRQIEARPTPFLMTCHNCHAPMDRNAASCPTCQWSNRVDCPHCQLAMQRRTAQQLTLDHCDRCKGIWFDHHELAAIWTLSLAYTVAQHSQATAFTPSDGVLSALDVLTYSPDLLFNPLLDGAALAAATTEAVEAVPELASGLFEVIGGAAGNVFEVILDIAGAIAD